MKGPTPLLGLCLVILMSSASTGYADWSRFYAPSAPTAPEALPAGPNACDMRVPALSAVPALGDAPQAGEGCGASPAYAPPDPTPAADPGVGPSCLRAILEAQARYGIPDNLLMGVGLQESGIDPGDGLTVWPWSVNAAGEGRFLSGPSEAISWVRTRLAAGEDLIDVGCMQINLRWHPDAFASLEEAFDPAHNVDYAARYLLSLYERVGDWRAAVGRYHSADPGRAARYLAGVETNLRVLDRLATPAAVTAAVTGAETGPAPFDGDLDRYLDALVSDTGGGAPRPLWSAGLGAGGDREGPVYGLYGPAGLRPVLPNFQRDF